MISDARLVVDLSRLTLQCDGRYLLLATLLTLFSSRSSSVVEQVPRDNTIALKEGWKRLWRVIMSAYLRLTFY